MYSVEELIQMVKNDGNSSLNIFNYKYEMQSYDRRNYYHEYRGAEQYRVDLITRDDPINIIHIDINYEEEVKGSRRKTTLFNYTIHFYPKSR